MFKVIVAGGRDFEDWPLLRKTLTKLFKNKPYEEIEIVDGCASGADHLGRRFHQRFGTGHKKFPADWHNLDKPGAVIRRNRQGRLYNAVAGHHRNEAMADYADALVAFWDGKSTGTADMIRRAERHNLQIRVIKY